MMQRLSGAVGLGGDRGVGRLPATIVDGLRHGTTKWGSSLGVASWRFSSFSSLVSGLDHENSRKKFRECEKIGNREIRMKTKRGKLGAIYNGV